MWKLILGHAWLNLWDKHMTAGRINQVCIWQHWRWHRAAGCRYESTQTYSESKMAIGGRMIRPVKPNTCTLLPIISMALQTNWLAVAHHATHNAHICIEPMFKGEHYTVTCVHWLTSPFFCDGPSVWTTTVKTQQAMSVPTQASTCISWRWQQLATICSSNSKRPCPICCRPDVHAHPPMDKCTFLFRVLK